MEATDSSTDSGKRETTVLFADLIGASDLYTKAGDAAGGEAIKQCVERLRKAVNDCGAGGRLVHIKDDKVIVLLSSPDVAADAAVAMHTAMEDVEPLKGTKLALGVGFHHGTVIQKDNDVFGDTVNLAARLVEQAANGQIITTEETAKRLAPLYRAWMRRLYAIEIRGRSGEVTLCELVWRADDSATQYSRNRADTGVKSVLTLRYKGQKVVRRREKELITIGRDDTCGLMIAEANASRQHCTIERRKDKFVLSDHSANGTFVIIEGEKEVELQREDFVLSRRGAITFGQPRASAAKVVEFSIEG
jgi:class 3 adenylate cyclase